MLIVAKSLDAVTTRHQRVIGFFGAPPLAELRAAEERYRGAVLLDLDVYYGARPSRIVPDAYCHIIRNCIDNSVALGSRLACVVAAIGEDKCNAGRYASRIIRDILGVEVIDTRNEDLGDPRPPLLSETKGPLMKRVVRIMQAIAVPLSDDEMTAARSAAVEPTHGFWGTPPHPIEILKLFPPTTHVFGWTRCVEQGRPADLDLEMQVPEGLPIVFFSQGFCPKAAIARRLAEKHRGMHVDAHEGLGAAITAKIEAFVRLSGNGGDS